MQFFRLKPSTIEGAGVGVFAATNIPKGAVLTGLFAEDDVRRLTWEEFAALDVPAEIKENFVTRYETECFLPKCLNRMSVGWYLNDSEDPNLGHDANYIYFALRDIVAGEELLIRYDDL
ncbi:SET domain protein [Gemmata sp. SH-PL17]|uniref:SET domain-containing protein-lysine N-methyltransferase n=1 Tax=Gemmata sp. SH-PL17 TaxID=1630693 RepID=UPI0004BAB508|nr:SET domain-containing protein [Gemmata sp. SH-PL17]AMV24995.1 SET domain protein [Gemmata sp. SH-PL17]